MIVDTSQQQIELISKEKIAKGFVYGQSVFAFDEKEQAFLKVREQKTF